MNAISREMGMMMMMVFATEMCRYRLWYCKIGSNNSRIRTERRETGQKFRNMEIDGDLRMGFPRIR